MLPIKSNKLKVKKTVKISMSNNADGKQSAEMSTELHMMS